MKLRGIVLAAFSAMALMAVAQPARADWDGRGGYRHWERRHHEGPRYYGPRYYAPPVYAPVYAPPYYARPHYRPHYNAPPPVYYRPW